MMLEAVVRAFRAAPPSDDEIRAAIDMIRATCDWILSTDEPVGGSPGPSTVPSSEGAGEDTSGIDGDAVSFVGSA